MGWLAASSPPWRQNGIRLPQQQVGLDADDIAQPQGRDPVAELAVVAISGISEHRTARNARHQGVAYEIKCDFRLGLEDDIRRDPGLCPTLHIGRPRLWQIEPWATDVE